LQVLSIADIALSKTQLIAVEFSASVAIPSHFFPDSLLQAATVFVFSQIICLKTKLENKT